MMNNPLRFAKILAPLTLLATAALYAAPATPLLSTPQPISAIRTVSVKETITFFDPSNGKATGTSNAAINIKEPNHVSAVLRYPGGHIQALYLVNGQTEYDCVDGLNYDKLSYIPGSDSHGLRDQLYIDVILHGAPNSLPPVPSENEGMSQGRPVLMKQTSHSIKTIGPDILDGHPMILTTFNTSVTSVVADVTDAGLVTPEMKIPVESQTRTRYWVDADTHLLSRILTESLSGNVWTPTSEIDFSDWKVNDPLADSLFAWSPDYKLVWANKPATPSSSSASSASAELVKGTRAPDFSAVAPDGKTVHLSDYKGKIVVLDFWATWCGPCQASMPHLEKVYQQVKNKNVAVLAVCVSDEQPKFDLWVKNRIGVKYHFPVAFDTNGRSKNSLGYLYHLQGIPTQFIIDKTGKIATTIVGYDDGDDFLEKGLRKLGV